MIQSAPVHSGSLAAEANLWPGTCYSSLFQIVTVFPCNGRNQYTGTSELLRLQVRVVLYAYPYWD
eukprot:522094-Rhodomonas_salina.3